MTAVVGMPTTTGFTIHVSVNATYMNGILILKAVSLKGWNYYLCARHHTVWEPPAVAYQISLNKYDQHSMPQCAFSVIKSPLHVRVWYINPQDV